MEGRKASILRLPGRGPKIRMSIGLRLDPLLVEQGAEIHHGLVRVTGMTRLNLLVRSDDEGIEPDAPDIEGIARLPWRRRSQGGRVDQHEAALLARRTRERVSYIILQQS